MKAKTYEVKILDVRNDQTVIEIITARDFNDLVVQLNYLYPCGVSILSHRTLD